MTKELFDRIASFVGLVLLMPLILVLVLIIKVTTKGPVFFVQSRQGLNGKVFKLLKFRTMVVRSEIDEENFSPGDTSMVTDFGKILRLLKFDEIPQLINVLKGDMSLVGPRPEVKKWTEVYPDRWLKVLSVKPGITDNASVEFLNEEELLSMSPDPERMYREIILPRKLDLYEDYVKNRSFLGDIKIILKTVKSVLLR